MMLCLDLVALFSLYQRLQSSLFRSNVYRHIYVCVHAFAQGSFFSYPFHPKFCMGMLLSSSLPVVFFFNVVCLPWIDGWWI